MQLFCYVCFITIFQIGTSSLARTSWSAATLGRSGRQGVWGPRTAFRQSLPRGQTGTRRLFMPAQVRPEQLGGCCGPNHAPQIYTREPRPSTLGVAMFEVGHYGGDRGKWGHRGPNPYEWGPCKRRSGHRHRDDAVGTREDRAGPRQPGRRLQPCPHPDLGCPGSGGPGNGERLWFRLWAVALVMQPEQIEGAGPHLFPRCHSAPAPLVQGGGAETPGPPGPTAPSRPRWLRTLGFGAGVLTLALRSCHRCPLPGNPPPPRGSGSWARLGSFRWFLG